MKTWKRFLALGLVTIITAMMFVGCGSSDISEGVAKNDYPITINGVTLNSQPTRSCGFVPKHSGCNFNGWF